MNKTSEVSKQPHTLAYTDSRGRNIELYGEITSPATSGRHPAVILCHGFNGHFSDFPAECERFAAHGFLTFAFDFCGAQRGGRSVGRTADEYTPYTMIEDLKAAVAYIKTLDFVDASRIFLFGGSQGGFVTAMTAADPDVRDDVAAVAMYFPALNIPDDWRRAPARHTPLMGYSIGGFYISSIRALDPFAVIGSFKKDVLIVYGDRDALVARKYIDAAVAAYGSRAELQVLPGAGHGFTGPALAQAVTSLLSFFESHL